MANTVLVANMHSDLDQNVQRPEKFLQLSNLQSEFSSYQLCDVNGSWRMTGKTVTISESSA